MRRTFMAIGLGASQGKRIFCHLTCEIGTHQPCSQSGRKQNGGFRRHETRKLSVRQRPQSRQAGSGESCRSAMRPDPSHSKDPKRRPKAVIGEALEESESRPQLIDQQDCDHRNAEQGQQNAQNNRQNDKSLGNRTPVRRCRQPAGRPSFDPQG